MMRVSIVLIGLGLVLGVSTSVWAADPAVKCVSDKVKGAGNYSACRSKAESKAIKKGEAPNYSKCDSKYSDKWQKAESKAGGACPTNGDEAAIQAQVQQFVDDLVAALEPPAPGVDPAVKCVADKVKEAGKYSACRSKAESKAIKKSEAPNHSKCDSKYSDKWQKAESKAAGACPTNGDEAAIQAEVQQFVDDLVAVLQPTGPCVGVGGACWFLGFGGESCDTACADVGLAYDPATETYAGSGGTLLQCDAVLDALGQTSPPLGEFGDVDCSLIGAAGLGCTLDNFSELRGRCTSPTTTSSASSA